MAMGMADYLFYSLMGVCVVFAALALLMAIIKVLTALKLSDAPTADAPAAAAPAAAGSGAEASPPARPLAPGTAGDLKLYDTDPRDAAMIMAIVADELQKPLNELRFISIREVKPGESGDPGR